jgi:hypothetical protein
MKQEFEEIKELVEKWDAENREPRAVISSLLGALTTVVFNWKITDKKEQQKMWKELFDLGKKSAKDYEKFCGSK